MKLLSDINKEASLNEAFSGDEEEERTRVENAVRFAGHAPGSQKFKDLVSMILHDRKVDPATYKKTIELD